MVTFGTNQIIWDLQHGIYTVTLVTKCAILTKFILQTENKHKKHKRKKKKLRHLSPSSSSSNSSRSSSSNSSESSSSSHRRKKRKKSKKGKKDHGISFLQSLSPRSLSAVLAALKSSSTSIQSMPPTEVPKNVTPDEALQDNPQEELDRETNTK
jgi:hypothetical protein